MKQSAPKKLVFTSPSILNQEINQRKSVVNFWHEIKRDIEQLKMLRGLPGIEQNLTDKFPEMASCNISKSAAFGVSDSIVHLSPKSSKEPPSLSKISSAFSPPVSLKDIRNPEENSEKPEEIINSFSDITFEENKGAGEKKQLKASMGSTKSSGGSAESLLDKVQEEFVRMSILKDEIIKDLTDFEATIEKEFLSLVLFQQDLLKLLAPRFSTAEIQTLNFNDLDKNIMRLVRNFEQKVVAKMNKSMENKKPAASSSVDPGLSSEQSYEKMKRRSNFLYKEVKQKEEAIGELTRRLREFHEESGTGAGYAESQKMLSRKRMDFDQSEWEYSLKLRELEIDKLNQKIENLEVEVKTQKETIKLMMAEKERSLSFVAQAPQKSGSQISTSREKSNRGFLSFLPSKKNPRGLLIRESETLNSNAVSKRDSPYFHSEVNNNQTSSLIDRLELSNVSGHEVLENSKMNSRQETSRERVGLRHSNSNKVLKIEREKVQVKILSQKEMLKKFQRELQGLYKEYLMILGDPAIEKFEGFEKRINELLSMVFDFYQDSG